MVEHRLTRLPILFLAPLFLIGISFIEKTPRSITIVGLLLILLVIAGKDLFALFCRQTLTIIVFSLFVLLACYINFLRFPGWYTYGWLNLMHLDVIYSATLGKVDIYYFRNHLSYPYFGLIPLSTVSQILNRSPIAMFVVLNALFFVAWFAIYEVYVRIDEKENHSATAVALLFLYSGATMFCYVVLAKIMKEISFHTHWHIFLPGIDMRASPIMTKYFYIDAMTLALPSLAFQYYFSRIGTRYALVMSGLFGIQTIISYPLLGPVSILIPVAAVIFRKDKRVATLGIAAILALALTFMLVTFRRDPGNGWSLFGGIPRIGHWSLVVIVVCSPFVAFLLSRAHRLKSIVSVQEPFFIFACCGIAYCAVDLPDHVQYKFLYGAMTVMGFAASGEIAHLISKMGRRYSLLIGPVLVTGLAIAVLEMGLGHPPLTGTRPSIDNSGFLVSSPESRKLEELIQQSGLSDSRGLIIADTDVSYSSLLRVPQYFNLNDEWLVGYDMPYSVINILVKGVNPGEFAQRKTLSEAILDNGKFELADDLKKQYSLQYVLLLSPKELAGCSDRSQKEFGNHAIAGPVSSGLYACIL